SSVLLRLGFRHVLHLSQRDPLKSSMRCSILSNCCFISTRSNFIHLYTFNLFPVTVLILLPTTTRTWVISTDVFFSYIWFTWFFLCLISARDCLCIFRHFFTL